MSAIFAARYSGGQCAAACGEPIIEGEMLTYIDDDLVHVGCSRDTGLRQVPATVCTKCWLVQPCDCDD